MRLEVFRNGNLVFGEGDVFRSILNGTEHIYRRAKTWINIKHEYMNKYGRCKACSGYDEMGKSNAGRKRKQFNGTKIKDDRERKLYEFLPVCFD